MHPDYLRQPDTTMPNDNEDVCFPSTQRAIMTSSSSRQRRAMESLGHESQGWYLILTSGLLSKPRLKVMPRNW
jgi:hypothetical protein